MKHFIGGWAAGTFIYGAWLATKLKEGKLIDAFLWAGICVGPLIGLAAWGLL